MTVSNFTNINNIYIPLGVTFNSSEDVAGASTATNSVGTTLTASSATFAVAAEESVTVNSGTTFQWTGVVDIYGGATFTNNGTFQAGDASYISGLNTNPTVFLQGSYIDQGHDDLSSVINPSVPPNVKIGGTGKWKVVTYADGTSKAVWVIEYDPGTFENAGTYEFESGGSIDVQNNANFTEDSGSTTTFDFGSTTTVEGTLTNNGELDDYGSISVTGALDNNLYMDVEQGATVTGTVTNGASGELIFDQTSTTTCAVNVSGSGEVVDSGSGHLTLSGNITGSIEIYQDATSSTVLTLSGVNTFSGYTDVNGDSVLQVGGYQSVGYDNGIANAMTTLDLQGGWLDLNGFGVQIDNLITTIGCGYIENTGAGPAQLTLNVASGTQTLSAIVAGNIIVKKIGSGTLVMNATNTYTNTTEVAGGTLQMGDGTHNGYFSGTTTIYVDSGTTLTFDETLNFSYTAAPLDGYGYIGDMTSNTVTLGNAGGWHGTENSLVTV